jgi:hypothetical protein
MLGNIQQPSSTPSSNSSRITEPAQVAASTSQANIALKSPRREVTSPTREESVVPSALIGLWEELSQQIRQARNDQLVQVYIDVQRLPKLCQDLVQLGQELARTEVDSRRPLEIVICNGRECADFDYSCLNPLTGRGSGLYLHSLKVEVSLRHGWPRKLSNVIASGEGLKCLKLHFLDLNLKQSCNVRQAVLRCLMRRTAPLDCLELEGFTLCMPHSSLKNLVCNGPKLASLRLISNETSPQLAADFRVADLISGPHRELRLRGLVLSAHHMDGVGTQLGNALALESLQIETCWLKGASEELFCGLINNRSLRELRFLGNRVESRKIPADRLLRVLNYPPALKFLQIDDFDDGDFRAELARLRAARPQLEIQQAPSFAGIAPNLVVRSGWHPDLDAQTLGFAALNGHDLPPQLVATPPYDADGSTDEEA